MRLSLPSFFRPQRAGANPSPPLGYPLFPAPRMAVLGCEVQEAPGVYCLPEWSAADVAQIRPLALAASFSDYARLAALIRTGALALPELQYPLLVFSLPGEGPLTHEQHDEMWAWFGLPCFEQIRDADGRLLAQECEARDGFHLTAQARPGDLGGRLVHTLCECGQVTPRVRIAPAQALLARA